MELSTAEYACTFKGKAQYLAEKMEYMTSYALTIKLADRLDNVSDLKGCTPQKKEKTINDTIYILNYLSEKRELTKAQTALCKAIEEKIEIYKNTQMKVEI